MANIKQKNTVNVVSFLKFAKKVTDTFFTGQITLTVDVEENGATVKKYLNIQVTSKIDLTEFSDKRVQIGGFLTGNEYKGKTSLQLRITNIIEQGKGKGNGSLTFTTRTSYAKEGEGDKKWTSAQASLRFNTGTAEAPNMQYVNFNMQGNKDTLKFKDGEIITVKGFLTAEYIPANGDRAGFTKPLIIAMEVLERSGEGTAPVAQPSKPQTQEVETPTEPEEKPSENPTEPEEKPADEINDSEIPF